MKAVAKTRKIEGYKKMSEYGLLKALEESENLKPPKTIKEIRKENYDIDKIIRDLRTLYESDEDYYETRKITDAFNDNYVEYESNADKDKRLSIEEYVNMIRPYLSHIIDDHKNELKIQLTVGINFISIKDSSETHSIYMHSKNILILTGYETDHIIEKLFNSLFEKYQKRLEQKVKKKLAILLIRLLHYIINFVKQA